MNPNLPPAEIPMTGKVMDRLRTTGIKGYRPVVDIEDDGTGQYVAIPKLAHWRTDPLIRDPKTGEIRFRTTFQPGRAYEYSATISVAPEVKTTARQKREALHRLLTQEAIRFTQPDGSVAWPASVQRELSEYAWKAGLAGKLSREEQVDLLVDNYLVASANKQKENDQKQITSSWHRNYVA